MDNDQAKRILTAYRPGGEDASDPFFAEALEQARRDPGLGEWLAGQRQFDESVQKAVQDIPVPEDLKDRLLLGGRVLETAGQSQGFFGMAWSLVFQLALAACVLILAGMAILISTGRPAPLTTDTLVREVVDLKLDGKISLAKMSGNTTQLRAWLASHGSPSQFEVPAGLDPLKRLGCQTYRIEGHEVSLVCFLLDKDRIVHFFTIESRGLQDPPGPGLRFFEQGGVTAATWSFGGYTHVLIGRHVDEDTLRRLI